MAGRLRVDEITNQQNGAPSFPSGFKFPNVDSTDHSVLDWYEEGQFTPNIEGGTTAGVATYGPNRYGFFVRVGRLVSISFRVGWTAHTGTGQIKITFTGMPYSIGGLAGYDIPPGVTDGLGALPLAMRNTAGGLWLHQTGLVYVNSAAGYTGVTMVSSNEIIGQGSFLA